MSDGLIGHKQSTKQIGSDRRVEANVGLRKIGDQSPYFSATTSEHEKRGNRWVESGGGADSETLHKHFPEYDAVTNVHLSDEHGVPMHAEANALYHAGASSYPDAENHKHLARHLRVSEDEAKGISQRVKSSADPKAEMHNVVEGMRPRWKQEAHAAKRVLGVFNDRRSGEGNGTQGEPGLTSL